MGYRIEKDDVAVITDKASEFLVALEMFAGYPVRRDVFDRIKSSEDYV